MNGLTLPKSGPRPRLAAACVAVASVFLSGADDDRPKPAVLIPPFENHSKHHENISLEVATGNKEGQPKRRYIVDRYTEGPRSLFQDMLVNLDGVTVVERQRVDTLLVESEFGLSGLVDSEKAVKLGKMLGANVVVMGTIVDIRDETKEFQGYGIKTKNTEVICKLNVRLLDMESGTIKFSKVVEGTRTYSQSTYGKTASSDRYFAAIEEALKKLGADPKFQAAVRGPNAGAAADGMVEIDFAPRPEGCDVEIDGKYVGGSPLKRRLQAGKEYKVRLSKDGFKSWEAVIVPEAGLKITRELGPSR
jgi:hypothetical protein